MVDVNSTYTEQLRYNQEQMSTVQTNIADKMKQALAGFNSDDCGCGCGGAGKCQTNPILIGLAGLTLLGALYFGKS